MNGLDDPHVGKSSQHISVTSLYTHVCMYVHMYICMYRDKLLSRGFRYKSFCLEFNNGYPL